METILDVRQIQSIIPHRYPFLLVDRIVEFESGKRIVGIKSVTVNEPFFQGHFPGMPIMPGVLIIEALAQTAAVLALRDLPDREKQLSLFSTIDNAKFRRPVVPGDTLHLELTVLRARARYCPHARRGPRQRSNSGGMRNRLITRRQGGTFQIGEGQRIYVHRKSFFIAR